MNKNNNYLFWFCVFFVIIKLIAISKTSFGLYGDEAQYWLWSKDPSFGYYSKPPLLSWLIHVVTYFFGNSFFVLKSIPIFLYCLTSLLIFIFSKKLFNDFQLSVCCALTFFLLPGVIVSSFLVSTDILLIFFWVLALIQILNIRTNPSYSNFLVLGLVVGLTFLSKYAGIYFIISLVFLTIIEKKFRIIFLKTPLKLLLLILSTVLVLLPNIIWNYQNRWLTLTHSADNASLDKIKINIVGFVEFLLSQVAMVGPILFFCFLVVAYKKIKFNFNERLLISFGLPALIIVLFESLLVRAHANWAAVSLVSLSILFISSIYKIKKSLIYLNNYLNLLFGFCFFILIGTTFSFGVFDRITGINDLVRYVDKQNTNNIDNIVVSDRLLFASLNYAYKQKKINFYSPYVPGDKIGNHFQLVNALPVNFSENFILIGNKNYINYLQKNKRVRILGNKSFPFSSNNIFVYEVLIE
tara:strand:+ start:180 stop:1583 length:1404 start_codon:yes stop_codon:yes gene_type:complete